MVKPKQPITSAECVEAVYYVRVSTVEQSQEGYSIPAQIKAAKAYAASKGFKVVGEFQDVQSAKRAGRTQFEAMCKFLRSRKKPTAIIVEKTDRLLRNIHDYHAIEVLLNEHDVEAHFYRENFVLSRDSNSNEKFIFGIKALMAKQYLDNLREECQKGMIEKAAQGHYPSVAPIGYLNNPVTRLIDVDPVRSPIVRRLFERYATGSYSLENLLVEAKAEGLARAEHGRGSVSRSTIERVLKNSFYHGDFVWRGKPYAGKHTPLISKELFDRVQAVFEGRPGSIKQPQTFAYTGLLTCGHCKCAITAEFKKGKYRYYRCSGSRGPCPNKSVYVREEAIGAMLGDSIRGLQLDERVYQTLCLGLKESLADQQRFHEEQVAKLTAEEGRLHGRLKQLYLDRLDAEVDEEIYRQLKTEFEAKLEQVRDSLDAHRRADASYIDRGIQLLELAQTAYASYLQRSPQEKRRLLEFVCWNYVFDAGLVKPEYRKPFDIIASAGMMTKKGQGPDASDPTSCPVEYPERELNPCYHCERVVS